MRLFLFVALVVLGTSAARAQAPDTTVYDTAEVTPELIGGLSALQDSLVYPPGARLTDIQGRVMVALIVDEQGRPTEVRVARGVRPDYDRAAVRAVESIRFIPGRMHGQPVKVRYVLPVTFSIGGPARRP